jgi:CHAT domain-containing protein
VSRGDTVAAPEVISLMTVQLDQLIGAEVLRGLGAGGIFTPANDMMHLNGSITVRRLPAENGEEYPESELVLRPEGGEPIRVSFPKGRSKLKWTEIQDLPTSWQDGLPPGEYSLSYADGGDPVIFGIEEEKYRHAALHHADQLRKVTGEATPTWLQLTVESLLNAKDGDGLPAPYHADAYDLLEDVPTETLPIHLRDVREQLLAQLRGDRVEGSDRDIRNATGIPAIDLARKLVERGRWIEAQKILQAKESQETPRAQALARLYEAVILAESGQATGEAAYTAFMQSLELMENSPPADAFRAHNNFASFLLTRSQDQAYDHAFQIASGVPNPLFTGLNDWHLSRVHFNQALELANTLEPHQSAAVRTNIARQYSLLADFIRLLNSVFPQDRQFLAGEAAATAESTRIARDVADGDDSQVDAATRAVAFEMLARIAHRGRAGEDCRLHARRALLAHLNLGSLAGAESAHRLIGLSLLRDAEDGVATADSLSPADDALKHFMVAHVLAESLRERFPVDESGLSRAGFFARRAYVNEQIIELLISRNEFAEALAYAEGAKARSFQDFLALRGGVGVNESGQLRSLPDLLADWPQNTAALEYFLGTEWAWVFVIDTAGRVTAQLIADADGRPVPSRELVTRVQQFLGETRGQASKMMRQHAAGAGFDKSWQDRLHEFYNQLIPLPARSKLDGAELVQIVPHHILHYFPFAALVTELDTQERISIEMPQPRFLIDEPYDLCFAPSMAAWKSLREASHEPVTNVNVIGISEFDNAPTLPGVEKDLENFRATFHDHPLKTLVGRDADESNVTRFLEHPGLLFVATHGLNVADQPLSSFLLCHATDDTDGRLTAAEILQHRIAAKLVVMSACYSGLADRSPLPGDDLFGLQRALLQSGAASVVSGLWDVYDETGAQLMHVFFKRLKAGDQVPTALANAQREFLSNRRKEGSFDPWMHPYFWAVYKATGSDLTRVGSGK